jgi:diaminopimelate epimerase
MKLRFTKMQGLGNDYLYVFSPVPENVRDLCVRLCDRHFGVGADGMIFIGESDTADFSMRIFNSDGSEADMCGNGIRCVGKYVYDRGLTQKTELTIETRSGNRNLILKPGADGRIAFVTVDMGKATLLDSMLQLSMGTGVAVSVGNPHVVCFTKTVKDIPLSLWGPMIEHDDRFPDGVNAEFVQVLSETGLRMRVWERGSGITLACGTGACASAFAAVYRGFCEKDRPIEVVLDGGSLFVTVQSDGTVMMEGPAETVFIGETEL